MLTILFHFFVTILGIQNKITPIQRRILKNWILDHEENPYPTREIKRTLSAQANLSISEITRWLNNERFRLKRATKKVSSKRMLKKDKDLLNNFYNNVNKYPNNNE